MSEIAFTSQSALVVDDDRVARELSAAVLRQAGLEVATASGGREALELASRLLPDVIVLDWMMPDCDGLEVCRSLRTHPALKHTYVLMLTARNGVDATVLGLENGANDFLTKPVENRELVSRVRSGLRSMQLLRERSSMEHMEALLKVAATLGHEISNPLVGMLARLRKLLSETDKLPLGVQPEVQMCLEEAEHIERLLHRLKTLRRPVTKSYLGNIQMLDLDPTDPA